MNKSPLEEHVENMRARIPDDLFAFNRNGLRMAIAALEDEIGELYDDWTHNKNHLGNALHPIRHELLDIAAVAIIAYGKTYES